MIDGNFWRGRKVFLTGHTGFKGGWLATWLVRLGAQVTGYALAPQEGPSYFASSQLQSHINSVIGDVRDRASLRSAVSACKPEIVFHLAAQPLVRRSYLEPVETFEVNVIGTINVLDELRTVSSVRAIVVITSDKCYRNHEWPWTYRESDALGGHDPYSASKACTELAVDAYRRSFFQDGVGIATVRAGNVIGGGDWAEDRLVPDAIRAFQQKRPLIVRNPGSVRPWQHVLEPLAGYLAIAEKLSHEEHAAWSGPWNFAPGEGDQVTAGEIADALVREWGLGSWRQAERSDESRHEAACLRLDSSKARSILGWHPRLNLGAAIKMTVEWYRRAVSKPETSMLPFSFEQIETYESAK